MRVSLTALIAAIALAGCTVEYKEEVAMPHEEFKEFRSRCTDLGHWTRAELNKRGDYINVECNKTRSSW